MIHLYVVEFDNGRLKIGRSKTPHKRIQSVAYAKEAAGGKVTRTFISRSFEAELQAETCALTYARALNFNRPIFGTREWFDSVGFDEARKHCVTAIRITKKAKASGIHYGHYRPDGRLYAYAQICR